MGQHFFDGFIRAIGAGGLDMHHGAKAVPVSQEGLEVREGAVEHAGLE